MAKSEASSRTATGYGSRYDKVFRENMEINLPGIIKNVLGIKIEKSKALKQDLQYTKERKPDLLQQVTDDTGKEYILHIEYQSTNDSLMACRMAEYNIMLRRSCKVPANESVQQYVIYLGAEKSNMELKIDAAELRYDCKLIRFSEIDYELFLNSEHPEDQILAILGDLKHAEPKDVLLSIVQKIYSLTRDELANNKYINQLHVISQLRNFEDDFKTITTMEPISSFFKIENDPFYKEGQIKGQIKGEARGVLKGKIETARVLKKLDVPLEKIAKSTGLSPDEIKKL